MSRLAHRVDASTAAGDRAYSRLHELDQVFVVPEDGAAQSGWRLLTGIKILVAAADSANTRVLIIPCQITQSARMIDGRGIGKHQNIPACLPGGNVLGVRLSPALRHAQQAHT